MTPSGQRVLGRVALVTGAASGIGRATAMLPAQEGARAMAVYLDGVFLGTKHACERFARPAEIPQGIAFLASDGAAYVTGIEPVIDGGLTV